MSERDEDGEEVEFMALAPISKVGVIHLEANHIGLTRVEIKFDLNLSATS
jgi:hypothetical protein